MREIDWNAEAVEMANYVSKHMSNVHRGAMAWRQVGIAVVFGNDGYSDIRTQQEIASLRDDFEESHPRVEEIGFGVDDEENFSWAILVKLHEPGEPEFQIGCLNDIVAMTASECGFGNALIQGEIGKLTVIKHRPKTDYSAN
jgi:hypothetical protein